MFDTLRHLLPRGRAWTMVVDRMAVRWLKALAPIFQSLRDYVDRMWRDNFPADTRYLESWERQWALEPGTLTVAERRARLDAVWKAIGGQSPAYITTTLQNAGFPVFTHEWWVDTPHGVPSPRDPRDYILPEFGGTDVDGFLLGNQLYQTGLEGPFSMAGTVIMHAGDPKALAGYFGAFVTELIGTFYCGPFHTRSDGLNYFTHPYYMYIGGEVFPNTVDIPATRRQEFERLVLSICPGHLWKVLRVRYV